MKKKKRAPSFPVRRVRAHSTEGRECVCVMLERNPFSVGAVAVSIQREPSTERDAATRVCVTHPAGDAAQDERERVSSGMTGLRFRCIYRRKKTIWVEDSTLGQGYKSFVKENRLFDACT